MSQDLHSRPGKVFTVGLIEDRRGALLGVHDSLTGEASQRKTNAVGRTCPCETVNLAPCEWPGRASEDGENRPVQGRHNGTNRELDVHFGDSRILGTCLVE
jgi:hypothetical protein